MVMALLGPWVQIIHGVVVPRQSLTYMAIITIYDTDAGVCRVVEVKPVHAKLLVVFVIA